MPDDKPLLLQIALKKQMQHRLGMLRGDDDDDQGGDTDIGEAKPDGIDLPGSLKKETKDMENARREQEQKGHRQFGKVNASDRSIQDTPGQEHGHGLKEHPLLAANQRFDGVDTSLNPHPVDNQDARREFDNERREQEKEKQLRLGYDPKQRNEKTLTSTPTMKPS